MPGWLKWAAVIATLAILARRSEAARTVRALVELRAPESRPVPVGRARGLSV